MSTRYFCHSFCRCSRPSGSSKEPSMPTRCAAKMSHGWCFLSTVERHSSMNLYCSVPTRQSCSESAMQNRNMP
nr:unnamed protein product [Digitaria exilis]